MLWGALMFKTITRRLAPLAASLLIVGCASTDGTIEGGEITADEVAAGEAWSQEGAVESHDDSNAAEEEAALPTAENELLTTESSTAWLDPDDAEIAEVPDVEVEGLDQTTACRRARGYKSGKGYNICVTTINGKLVEVNTARKYLRMRAAAKKRGVSLYIVSGFRTMAQQRYLYKLYKQGKGNLAAPPGYSNHQSGRALDLNTHAPGVYSFLANRGARFRFKRTVPSEKWHWERY